MGWLCVQRGHVFLFLFGAGAAFGSVLNGDPAGVIEGGLLAWWAW